MEVAFLISLRHRIHSLKLNLNGRMAGSTRVCLMLLMLLSLVSKQWGMCSGTSDKQDQWFQPFPLTASKCLSVSLTRRGGDSAAYIVRIVSVVNNGFYWTDASYVTGTHGSGDPNLWIAICQ